MLSKITYGTYILFGILTFMGAGFIWFFVPETKRLTLEEMVRQMLKDGVTLVLLTNVTGCCVWFRGHCSGRL